MPAERTSSSVGVAFPAGQFVPFWRQTEAPFTCSDETKSCEPEAEVKNRSVVVT